MSYRQKDIPSLVSIVDWYLAELAGAFKSAPDDTESHMLFIVLMKESVAPHASFETWFEATNGRPSTKQDWKAWLEQIKSDLLMYQSLKLVAPAI